MKKLFFRSFLFAAFFALAVSAQGARVRVVHASPDAPNVDILVNNAKVLENLPFREYSEYLTIPGGTYNVKINVTGTTTSAFEAPVTVMDGKDYTVAAVGYAGGNSPAFTVKVLEDDNTAPPDGSIKVRVMHAAPGAPAVDVYWTTPYETLDGKTPVLSNVPFNVASAYLTVPISMYQARVAVAGTKTIAIDSMRMPTWGGMVRTIIAVDKTGGGAPFGFIILPDRN
jgi:hypothetical protein